MSCWWGKTLSKSGSDPNCNTRVTHLAFGFACRAANSVSRRLIQMSSPSKPNLAKMPNGARSAFKLRGLQNLSLPRRAHGLPDHSPKQPRRCHHYKHYVNTNADTIARNILEVLAVASAVKSNVARVEMVSDVLEFRYELRPALTFGSKATYETHGKSKENHLQAVTS